MNEETITLKINASDLQISNLPDLDKLNLPKELYDTALKTLEDHNRDADFLFRFSCLLTSLFFLGIILITLFFQFMFFPSLLAYCWIFIPCVLLCLGGTYLFRESRKHTLIERTLVRLVEGTFEVLIINKQLRAVEVLEDSSLSKSKSNKQHAEGGSKQRGCSRSFWGSRSG